LENWPVEHVCVVGTVVRLLTLSAETGCLIVENMLTAATDGEGKLISVICHFYSDIDVSIVVFGIHLQAIF
jgi:hypothetical protein